MFSLAQGLLSLEVPAAEEPEDLLQDDVMITRMVSEIRKIAWIGLLLLAACSAAGRPAAPMVADDGHLSIFLQPLPQEVGRLSFRIAALDVLRSDGEAIPLSLNEALFNQRLVGVQKRLAHLDLPPGQYRGVALSVEAATVSGSEGPVELVPPPESLIVDFPFTIRKGQSETLFLSLAATQLVSDGTLFTPSFSLWQAERPLTGLTGFVSNSGSGSLTVFNKRSVLVTSELGVGARPMSLALDQQRDRLYVALTGDDRILALDVNSGTILGHVPLRFGDRPEKLILIAEGKILLSLNPGSDSLSLIDTSALFENQRVLFDSEADGLFVSDDETLAYVLHRETSALTLVNLETPERQTRVALEELPQDGVAAADGLRLFLINAYSGNLSVLAAGNLNVTAQIYIGSGASCLKYDDHSGLVYVGKENGEIAVVDPRSLMAIDHFFLDGMISNLTIDNEENALFAVLPEQNQLVKIDLVSKHKLGRLELETGANAVVVMGQR